MKIEKSKKLNADAHHSSTSCSNSNTTTPDPLNPPIKRRVQVKIACIHCKKACKKCDNVRPCTRCVRLGLDGTCVDAPRKERKKSSRRIPYSSNELEQQENTNNPSAYLSVVYGGDPHEFPSCTNFYDSSFYNPSIHHFISQKKPSQS